MQWKISTVNGVSFVPFAFLCFHEKALRFRNIIYKRFPRKYWSDRNQCIIEMHPSGTRNMPKTSNSFLFILSVKHDDNWRWLYDVSQSLFEKCSEIPWKMYVKVSIHKNELTKYLNLSHFLRFSENLRETPFSEHQFLDVFVLIDFVFDSALTK